jgi:hypothetical protein
MLKPLSNKMTSTGSGSILKKTSHNIRTAGDGGGEGVTYPTDYSKTRRKSVLTPPIGGASSYTGSDGKSRSTYNTSRSNSWLMFQTGGLKC